MTPNTPGRTELPAAQLDWLLHSPNSITLTTVHHDVLGPALRATTLNGPLKFTTATGGPWTHTIPATDIPTLRTWLHRLNPTTPVRIGTAHLADGSGILLTARTGPQAIRLHQPTQPAA